MRYNKQDIMLPDNHRDDAICIVALCQIYKVRIRIFKYNVSLKRLNIVYEHGGDDLDVPIILLSKHLNKYYNIIVDLESLDKIPFYYQDKNASYSVEIDID